MSKTHVYTSAAFNYIPKVRMLFESIRRFHPDWVIHLALADRQVPEIDLSAEPFDNLVVIDDLNIPDSTGWIFCHSIVELATAIKPFVLQHLLAQPDVGRVIYLDPDTVLFSPLTDVVEALEEANIALTPHQTDPEKDLSAVIDNEICSLKHGIYNLGFAAISNTEVGRDFAKWWSTRLYYFCRDEIENGLFTDQRWIDLVPAFFEGVAIMRTPRLNVSTWNLTTREVTNAANGGYLVNGEPLGFYHFTGFDSGAHRIMALKNAGSASPVHQLISWYTQETEKVASDPLAKTKWAFGTFSDGTPISKVQRRVYRTRDDLQKAFPNPFLAEGYLNWWKQSAKREYPQLGERDGDILVQRNLRAHLTPGFGRPEGQPTAVNAALLWNSLKNPRSGAQVAKRAWEILRTEGVKGLSRRAMR